MMEEWKEIKIADVVECNALTINKNYSNDSIEYVDTGSVFEGSIIETILYDKELAPGRAKRRVKHNSIIYSTVRPNLRHYAILKNPPENLIVSTGFAVLDAVPTLIDPHYLYQYLTLNSVTDFLYMIAEGAVSAYPSIRPEEILNIKIKVPSLPLQQKIASILAVYDELIEVNNQQIALLEEEARELYKEWFVRMRFPGYKSVKFVNGVPEGWEYCKINDVLEIMGGGTPNTQRVDYWENGTINWFAPTDLTGNLKILYSQSSKKITEKGLKYSSARLFPAYSVMMTSRATIGELGINTEPATTNQGFIVCIPNEKIPLYYLYFYLYFYREFLIMYASGATFLEISKGTFKKLDILVPSDKIVKQYNEIAKSIFSKIENLQLQNQHLAEIRDRLLPRLMSGKLSIKG